MMPEETRLDLRGLHCPMPVLRARKALLRLPPGAVLALECTDPLTVIDIPHFVAQAGHRLLTQAHEGGVYRYRIARGIGAADGSPLDDGGASGRGR